MTHQPGRRARRPSLVFMLTGGTGRAAAVGGGATIHAPSIARFVFVFAGRAGGAAAIRGGTAVHASVSDVGMLVFAVRTTGTTSKTAASAKFTSSHGFNVFKE